jgi:hypothetical protein
MGANIYYLGGEAITLDTDESRARLVQRLRQYLELRNLNVLIGNGASLPLGAPRIGDVAQLRPEFEAKEYRLTNEVSQERALKLLEQILTKNGALGVEPLLTALANIQSIEQLLGNPDDQEYFKSVISGINRELLDQLPALAQQQAIVLGDCVPLPLQVRINTVDPRPRSEDPSFTREWSSEAGSVPDIEQIAARWEGKRN